MYKYVIKRLLFTIPVLLGVTFIVFTIMALTPGDPGRLILGQTARQEAVDQLNHELGYDQPFFTRFFNYIKDIVTKLVTMSFSTLASLTGRSSRSLTRSGRGSPSRSGWLYFPLFSVR